LPWAAALRRITGNGSNFAPGFPVEWTTRPGNAHVVAVEAQNAQEIPFDEVSTEPPLARGLNPDGRP